MKISSKTPIFDGEDYLFWSVRMKNHLMSMGLDIWLLVEQGYDVPKVIPTGTDSKKKYWEHVKALNTLQSGLSKTVLAKVINCVSAKQLWDKLGTIYAGDSKVKKAKLQTYRLQYEGLKMREDEKISEYFERVQNIVNTIKGLGGKISEEDLVEKVLRTLPMIYNPKVSSLEDKDDLDQLTIDDLYGILTAYELRLGDNHIPKGEAAFKASKKTSNQKKISEPIPQDDFDIEEANFIKKLQKGSGKYKGKLPFKCFDCGKIGHFASKCPYKNLENSNVTQEPYKKRDKSQYKKQYKRNFYSKEENNSTSEDSDSEDEVLFLGIEEVCDDDENEYEEKDVKVNMEGELLSALSELRKYKFRYRELKSLTVEQKKKHEQQVEEMREVINTL